jgi:hypothetical protein
VFYILYLFIDYLIKLIDMKNMTHAKWHTDEIERDTKNEVKVERKPSKPINISKELKSLQSSLTSLKKKYTERSNKELYDSIINLEGSIRSLQEVS